MKASTERWNFSQNSLKFSISKKLSFLKVPRLLDNLTSQELVKFLFTKRRHVLTFQIYVFLNLFNARARQLPCEFSTHSFFQHIILSAHYNSVIISWNFWLSDKGLERSQSTASHFAIVSVTISWCFLIFESTFLQEIISPEENNEKLLAKLPT